MRFVGEKRGASQVRAEASSNRSRHCRAQRVEDARKRACDTASRVYPTCGALYCATRASPSCGAIHPVRKKVLTKKMDHPKSGSPDFGHFECASRINPTCVVNGVPADNVGGVPRPAGDERVA